jgi:hypothetical protein
MELVQFLEQKWPLKPLHCTAKVKPHFVKQSRTGIGEAPRLEATLPSVLQEPRSRYREKDYLF